MLIVFLSLRTWYASTVRVVAHTVERRQRTAATKLSWYRSHFIEFFLQWIWRKTCYERYYWNFGPLICTIESFLRDISPSNCCKQIWQFLIRNWAHDESNFSVATSSSRVNKRRKWRSSIPSRVHRFENKQTPTPSLRCRRIKFIERETPCLIWDEGTNYY